MPVFVYLDLGVRFEQRGGGESISPPAEEAVQENPKVFLKERTDVSDVFK